MFSNLTMSTIIIPSGTILQSSASDGIQFITVEEVSVPAGIGEIVECQAEAPSCRK